MADLEQPGTVLVSTLEDMINHTGDLYREKKLASDPENPDADHARRNR